MRRSITGIAVIAFALMGSIAPASAAGNAQSGPTVGDCISDGFYGNEPNTANGAPGGPAEQAPGSKGGNIVPTQSPGPTRTLPDGTVVQGNSIGDYQRGAAVPGIMISIPMICRTLVG